MIKEVGTLGVFVKFNSTTASGKLLDIFSSASANEILFSSSVTATNLLRYTSTKTTASAYINGALKATSGTSASLSTQEWVHLSFSFYPKLIINSSANFLIRFGNASADFSVQNLYMTDTRLSTNSAYLIHNEFTTGSATISSGDLTASSMGIYDRDEKNHSSSVTNIVYQPPPNFKNSRFLCEVDAVMEVRNENGDLTGRDWSASSGRNNLIPPSLQYIDGVEIQSGYRVLSLFNNAVYNIIDGPKVGASVVLDGSAQYVHILNGNKYKDFIFVKNQSSSFTASPFLEKIVYIRAPFL
jgi:hypothetical protein